MAKPLRFRHLSVMADRSPDEILASAVESSRNVKFGRGVVSKTTYVAGLVVALWLMIAWKWDEESLAANGGLVLAGLIATVFAVWYIRSSQNFAERNPGQALLDGAEFLEWSRLEAAAKGVPSLPQQPAIEVLPGKRLGGTDG